MKPINLTKEEMEKQDELTELAWNVMTSNLYHLMSSSDIPLSLLNKLQIELLWFNAEDDSINGWGLGKSGQKKGPLADKKPGAFLNVYQKNKYTEKNPGVVQLVISSRFIRPDGNPHYNDDMLLEAVAHETYHIYQMLRTMHAGKNPNEISEISENANYFTNPVEIEAYNWSNQFNPKSPFRNLM